jgi:prolyl-tRNA synthetase
MRYTRLLLPTVKEDPSDAEVVSHRLMLRAGLIRQVARGIYDILPLGLRTVRKIEAIVREELDAVGCQEVSLPLLSPAELWRESGRWDAYGPELLRLVDRSGREFCVGPTHEEVMTDLVRGNVRSYRELPLNLYQVNTKFRDEIRPRFGLMRGREFLMKDGYSFHVDEEDCRREYHLMYDTYSRIFTRCGLDFRAVEADTGAIGGSGSHEFQVLAESGEDLILSCDHCDYAANVEKAELAVGEPGLFESSEPTEVSTPGAGSIEDVSAMLSEPAGRFVKTLLYVADDRGVAALVRGDDQLSEAKLKRALGVSELRMADADEVKKMSGAPQGFAGPVGLEIELVVDLRLRGATGMITGANRADLHLSGIDQQRDFPVAEFHDLREAAAGDPCPRCNGGSYQAFRGIEVGQVFYLGSKYSEAMGATYLDTAGNECVMQMGTYGIGITRTMAAAIEQNHDDDGIIWPPAIAPVQVLLLPVKWKDDDTRAASEKLYEQLLAAGVEVILDDRDERAGVKFNDADLLGIPWRVTIGPRGVKQGTVELRERRSGESSDLALDSAAEHIVAAVSEALAR